MATAGRRGRRRWRPHLLWYLVFVALAAVSLIAFAAARQVVDDQEERLLKERADEVGALLTNSINSIESSLQVLGPIGASPEPAAMALFARSATPLVKGNTKTIGVATGDGGRFQVVAVVGDGPAMGAVLAGARGALAARALALSEPQLVSDLVTERGETRLVLALQVVGSRGIAYQESVLHPDRTSPSTPDSPFQELRVALYASSGMEADRLVVTTEADVPLAGSIERQPFAVGAGRWLLAVGARHPLVGSFAATAPWLFLAGGLVTALLTSAIVEMLPR